MLIYLAAGLLGLVFVTLVKMSAVKKDFEAAGHPFIVGKFFRDETIGIASGVTFILIMAITINEWRTYSESVTKFITSLFVLGGAIGAWTFQLFLGKSKKYIRTVIDIKTNIVDNELGKSNSLGEIKQKAILADKDISSPIK